MSLAVEEKTQEEKELDEAIRLSQLEYQKEEEKRIEASKSTEKKAGSLGPLPPLVLGTSKPNRPIEEFKVEESKLKEEIEVMKKKE